MLEIGMNGERLYKIDAALMGMAVVVRLQYDSLLAGATGDWQYEAKVEGDESGLWHSSSTT